MKIKPAILFLSLAVILFSFFNITCKDNGMNLFDRSFSITTEDVSCTEVWLKIKIGPGNYDREVILKRDTVVLFRRTINELEATIIDTNLLPNHTYTYTAQLLNNSETSSSTAQTMDTTSHNFTWQTFTLGDGSSSSSLHDVAIINDTCIWAVGEIYRNDTVFNAAKWNGQAWELKRILFDYQGYPTYSYLQSIYAFSANDIWFEAGIHWNGSQFETIPLNISFPSHVNKIWGSSSSDLYIVGNSGLIAHYNGSSWTKIESGTSLNINDIWGAWNGKTNKYEILCVASSILESFEKEVIQIEGINARVINKEGINGTLSSIWFRPGRKYYVAGGGSYETYALNDQTWITTKYNFAINFLYRFRGTETNDILTAGGHGDVLHFNGTSWRSYLSETRLSNGNYYSLAMKGNLLVVVGQDNPTAVILMGRR